MEDYINYQTSRLLIQGSRNSLAVLRTLNKAGTWKIVGNTQLETFSVAYYHSIPYWHTRNLMIDIHTLNTARSLQEYHWKRERGEGESPMFIRMVNVVLWIIDCIQHITDQRYDDVFVVNCVGNSQLKSNRKYVEDTQLYSLLGIHLNIVAKPWSAL